MTSAPTPGSMFGGYRIESFVARGGMGAVYKATQLALSRTVALKVVAAELADEESFRERFKREAMLSASLDHPNILPVYEAGEVDGQLFLAMRFVDGTDLDTIIQREGTVAPARAAAIVTQVAAALDAAHSRGLVHRDVKPGNILIAHEYGEERAYLADFGLTKNAGAGAGLTRTGQMVGTLDYIAPEQAQGSDVDGRADTYALACVLYRAVTGRVPFDRPSDVAKMWAHLNDPAPSAAAASGAVSHELDTVIRRGMAKRPDERYASSSEFARAAAAAAAGGAAPVAGGLDATRLDVTQVDAPIVAPPLAIPPTAPPLTPPPLTPPPLTPPPFAPPPASEPPRRGNRTPIYVGIAAVVVAIGVVVALVAGGGGSGSANAHHGTTPPALTTPTAVTSTPLSTVATTPPSTPTTTTPAVSAAAEKAAHYRTRVEAITARISHTFRQIPNGADFGKASFTTATLEVAAGLRATADDLNNLSPPFRVLADHEALITHLHEMEGAFRSLAIDSDERNFSGAAKDLHRASVALTRVDRNIASVLRLVKASD